MPIVSHRVLACLALTSALAATSEAARTIESRPTASPVTIDGDPSDWNDSATVYLDASLRAVALSHDRENLYLMFRFADERLARELLDRGVLLWINGDGKTKHKDEAYGLRYAGSTSIEVHLSQGSSPSRGGRIPGAMPEGEPPRLLGPSASSRIHPDELTRVRLGVKEIVGQGPASEPAAESAPYEGGYCYELRVPIADVGGEVVGQPASKARKIAIGIQIGGLTDAERELMERSIRDAMGARGGPPPSGGMAGRGGTGGLAGMGGPGGGGPSGGGRAGGGHGDVRKHLDPEVEWLQVVLEPSDDTAQ